MKRSKLAPLLGVLVLLVACVACGNTINRLKARDQLKKGVAAFRNAQFQTAIEHFKQAITWDPQLINARLYLAMSYFQQYAPGGDSAENIGMGKQAIAAFDDVLQHDPQNSTALASMGQVYFNMRNFDKAKECQNRRIQADPNNPEPYYYIGVIDYLQSLQHQAKMRTELKLTYPKDPNNPNVLPPLPEKSRVELAEENGALIDEGIKALQEELKLKPNDSDGMAYYNLLLRQKADIEAQASAREADLKQADEWIQKAMDARKQAAGKAAPTS